MPSIIAALKFFYSLTLTRTSSIASFWWFSPLCFYYDCRLGARQQDVIYKSWYHSLLYFWSSAPELRSGYSASCSHVSQESDQHNPFVEDWHALVVRQCARILMLIMHSSPPSLQKAWHVLLLWFAPWPLPALSHNCATTNPCNLCSTLFVATSELD